MTVLRHSRYLSIFVLETFLLCANAQESTTNLSCAGQLEFNTDAKREVKQSVVSVVLDTKSKVLQISDLWGCLMDMAPPSGGQSDGLSCISPLPVQVSEREFIFALDRTNTTYATKTTLTLNRYTGALSVQSFAVALPAAKASWSNFVVEGTYACTIQQRKF